MPQLPFFCSNPVSQAVYGTRSSSAGRQYDTMEYYGLLSSDYQSVAVPRIVELLQTIEK